MILCRVLDVWGLFRALLVSHLCLVVALAVLAGGASVDAESPRGVAFAALLVLAFVTFCTVLFVLPFALRRSLGSWGWSLVAALPVTGVYGYGLAIRAEFLLTAHVPLCLLLCVYALFVRILFKESAAPCSDSRSGQNPRAIE